MLMALFLSFAGSRYLLLFILSSYFHFVELSKSMVFSCTFISYSCATFFIVQSLCDAKFSIKISKGIVVLVLIKENQFSPLPKLVIQ